MKNFKPNIVIFRCNWCSPAGAERAMASKMKDNFHPRLIKTSCTGRIEPTFVFDAFAKGADGVMIAGCRPGDCHYVTGNYKAGRNVLLLKRTLSQLGIEPERVQFSWISAGEGERFAQVMTKVTNDIKKIGPAKRLVKGA